MLRLQMATFGSLPTWSGPLAGNAGIRAGISSYARMAALEGNLNGITRRPHEWVRCTHECVRHKSYCSPVVRSPSADQNSALNNRGSVACVCARCCGRMPNSTTLPGLVSIATTAARPSM